MGIFALILSIVGGLCAVVGILTAAEVTPDIGAAFTWMFWFGLAGVLLIGSIAAILSRSPYE